MPKKKTTSAKKLRKAAAGRTKPEAKSVKELVEAAAQAMQSQDAHQAITLYDAAMQLASASPEKVDMDITFVLEKRAEAKVSISDPDSAREDYAQALQIVRERQPAAATIPSQINGDSSPQQPITSHTPEHLERMASLLLYMGQLSGGHDAVASYQEGIDMLKNSLSIRQSSGHDEKATVETRKQLGAACCSMAEVYLTDLCDEPNAEQQCEAFVQQALSCTDHDGTPVIDALQTAASLLFSQCKPGEAVNYIQQCYDKIQGPCENLSKLVGMFISPQQLNGAAVAAGANTDDDDQAMELTQIEAVQALPGFEFRCQTAKLLLEGCGYLTQEKPNNYQAAAQKCALGAVHVLGSLMSENDEVIEIWFLAGDAHAFLNFPDVAQQYYERSIEMFQQVQQSLEQELDMCDGEEQEEEIQQQVDEITCQLEEIQQKLQELANAKADEPEPMEE